MAATERDPKSILSRCRVKPTHGHFDQHINNNNNTGPHPKSEMNISELPNLQASVTYHKKPPQNTDISHALLFRLLVSTKGGGGEIAQPLHVSRCILTEPSFVRYELKNQTTEKAFLRDQMKRAAPTARNTLTPSVCDALKHIK